MAGRMRARCRTSRSARKPWLQHRALMARQTLVWSPRRRGRMVPQTLVLWRRRRRKPVREGSQTPCARIGERGGGSLQTLARAVGSRCFPFGSRSDTHAAGALPNAGAGALPKAGAGEPPKDPKTEGAGAGAAPKTLVAAGAPKGLPPKAEAGAAGAPNGLEAAVLAGDEVGDANEAPNAEGVAGWAVGLPKGAAGAGAPNGDEVVVAPIAPPPGSPKERPPNEKASGLGGARLAASAQPVAA
mmetsp:Transcript_68619/g.188166  ORF Transcript_68619/g.188166 Transcript_68619/m.188166 type:complete len:243 (-) Transcript_68619:3240-3968(-)